MGAVKVERVKLNGLLLSNRSIHERCYYDNRSVEMIHEINSASEVTDLNK